MIKISKLTKDKILHLDQIVPSYLLIRYGWLKRPHFLANQNNKVVKEFQVYLCSLYACRFFFFYIYFFKKGKCCENVIVG